LTQTESCRASAEDSLVLPASILCSTPEETITLGKQIAKFLQKGSVAALKGPFGAGKTCLAKGIAIGLGVKEAVTSPSYAIVCEYEGVLEGNPIKVFHIDAYRLAGNDDFSAIGGEEMIFGEGVSIVEWCERIPDFIPKGALRVDIQIADDEKRRFHIYPEK
jgi:tRNA threonylcarbamoyladenosine biosynthesis protein TsaE